MRSGRLRHKVVIEQPTETQTTSGAVSTVWTTFATVWAGIEPLQGREFIEAGGSQAVVTHRIAIRYLAGVTPKMRVVHDSRNLTIESVININERNADMHLMCREAV